MISKSFGIVYCRRCRKHLNRLQGGILLEIRMFGVSDIHRGENDKPNEDYFVFDPHGFAVVSDGVTIPRLPDGTYRAELGPIPARVVCNEALQVLQTTSDVPERSVQTALTRSNTAVRDENVRRGIREPQDFLGATAVVLALVIQDESVDAVDAAVGWIGDPLAILVRADGTARVLTRNQLTAWHRFGRAYAQYLIETEHVTPDEANRLRIAKQRAEIRNRKDARSDAGERIGFGVLTGDPGAADFFEVECFKLARGDRLLLGSDALRVFEQSTEESVGDYEFCVAAFAINLEQTLETIIAEVRRLEEVRNVRSDDATIVVVEVR